MSDTEERETARLWRIHKTVHHMVHDRGYIVSQAELDMTLSEFVQTYGSGGIVREYDSTWTAAAWPLFLSCAYAHVA